MRVVYLRKPFFEENHFPNFPSFPFPSLLLYLKLFYAISKKLMATFINKLVDLHKTRYQWINVFLFVGRLLILKISCDIKL